MKKFICLFILAFVFFENTKAQSVDFEPFKVDVLIGLGASKSGFNPLFSIEPKYNFKNNLCVGIRWELADIYRIRDIITSGPSGIVNSFIFTGELYAWHDIRVRPFVGVGSGIYLANFDVDKNQGISSKLGFMLRTGLQIGHFRVVAEKNFIPDSAFNLDYFTLKLGTTFGGGKRKML